LGQWPDGEQRLVLPGPFPVSHDLIVPQTGPLLGESERAGFQATSLLDHIGLFQDLEELLGVRVEVITWSVLKPRDDCIRAKAIQLWPEESITSWPI
jgi:hypothetical protein